MLKQLLNPTSYLEECKNKETLELRQTMVKKVDCALTVKNNVEPLLTTIKLNIILALLSFAGYALFGLVAGAILALTLSGLNIFISKKTTDKIESIKEKYKIR